MRKFLIICIISCACKLQAQVWSNVIGSTPKGWAHFVASAVDSTNNILYLGGQFYLGNPFPTRSLIKYDGTTFDTLQSGLDDFQEFNNTQVSSLAMFQGKLYVAGNFDKTGKYWCKNLGRWSGSNWDTVNFNPNSTVMDLKIYNNELYVIGDFTTIGGISANGIAKYDGTNWASLSHPYGCINGFAMFKNTFYISSAVTAASSCANLSYYNGTNWVPWVGVSGDVNKGVNGIAVIDTMMYVYGRFDGIAGTSSKGIAGFNGTKWFGIGAGLSNSNWETIYDITKVGNDVYISGHFNTIESMSTGTITPEFQMYTNLIKFNNDTMCSISPPFAYDIHGLVGYNNDLYAYGSFMKIGNDSVWGFVKWQGGNSTIECKAIPITPSIIGVSEYLLEQNNSISIYPNPFTNILNITDEQNQFTNTTITVKNSLGQSVYTGVYIPQINLLHLPNGIYFLTINGTQINKTIKIIKQ